MSNSRRTFIRTSAAVACLAAVGRPAYGQQKTIKIGFIGPLSGGNAHHGIAARNGYQLAVEQANASGLPFRIETVVLDDASDPTTGVNAALKLTNDQDVVAAIGHWNSPVALATTPVFNRAGIPFIVWGAISPRVTEQNLPFVTRVTPTLTAENTPLAAWMAKTRGIKTIVIVSDTSDYGKQNTLSFTSLFEQNGGKVVGADAAPVGTTDFRALLTRLKPLNAEGLYFGGVITEAGIVRRQMTELGMNIPMYGISGIYDPKFIEVAGDAAEGTVVGVRQASKNPRSDAMESAYVARRFAEPSTHYTAFAYDAIGIIVQALRSTGYTDKAALARAIRATRYEGVLGETTFDSNGQTQVSVAIHQFVARKGQWVRL
ncbi:MAG: branched-chain amino acid ABC transporter substrate-binding protein [Burkholderiales bacterium]|nr:branched-chain amino acid ABC transporter substrate-binding protein [Burkholderiales bacterium]MCC7116041.1 branched-chain amino acid ABC transporter substrate-binding protein [Burkholderiales bacterium]